MTLYNKKKFSIDCEHIDSKIKEAVIKCHTLLAHNKQLRKKDIFLVFVEGCYDELFYKNVLEKSFPQKKFIILHLNGKDDIQTIISANSNGSIKQYPIFGIIDYDYSWHTGDMVKRKNLFHTDTHDLETTLLYSKSVRSNLYRTLNVGNVNDYGKKGELEELFTYGLELGYIRMGVEDIKKSRNLGIRVSDIDFREKIKSDFLPKDFANILLESIIEKNNIFTKIKTLRNEIIIQEKKNKERYPPSFEINFKICQGHDLITYLVYFQLKKVDPSILSNNNPGSVITKKMINNYPAVDFSKTTLYNEIGKYVDGCT